MKYVRTRDRIVDVEKFINKEKDTPYYKDFIFDEITKDGVLKWTAVGTEQNSMEEQRGIRCHFSATLNSEMVAQSDTIEELCDELVVHNPSNDENFFPKYFVYKNNWENMLKPMSDYQKSKCVEIYGAIWTEWGLKYVAKINEKGELELL